MTHPAVRRRLLILTALVTMIATLPLLWPHPFLLSLATQALVWAILAVSWDMLSGQTGQVSFGHAGFLAIGAYTAAVLSKELSFPPMAGLASAFALAGVAGLLVGFPALRLRGHYLAIVTLGFAEIVQLTATNWTSLTGGPFGIHDFGTLVRQHSDAERWGQLTYVAVLLIAVVAITSMYLICRFTPAGKAFRAIREDQLLAQGLGINTTAYKLLAFSLSAAMAGLAGGLYAYVIRLVGPGIGSATTSAMVIGMVVFGGLGTLWGPALGAVALFLISEALRFVGVVYNLVAVGLVIMIFVIFVPSGMAGLILKRPQRLLRADAVSEPEVEFK